MPKLVPRRVAGVGCLALLIVIFLGYFLLARRPTLPPEAAPAPAPAQADPARPLRPPGGFVPCDMMDCDTAVHTEGIADG